MNKPQNRVPLMVTHVLHVPGTLNRGQDHFGVLQNWKLVAQHRKQQRKPPIGSM